MTNEKITPNAIGCHSSPAKNKAANTIALAVLVKKFRIVSLLLVFQKCFQGLQRK